ncbi:MAG: DNA-packaging protein, partial [Patescibacteria group bacterium]|nr:DNA-packaging protein [Patescibacteria group bacterium]
YYREVIEPLVGTRLGRQEIDAEILDDAPGALWKRDWIEKDRITLPSDPTERESFLKSLRERMKRIVVAMDPAATSSEDSDEMGIIVAGLGTDNHGYVLADLTARLSPDQASRRAIKAYDDWQADRIVGEVNNGGEWIGTTVSLTAKAMKLEGVRRSATISYKAVHASRGKQTRAEPIAALSEQHKIHHAGTFPLLEDQLCSWEPLSGDRSPDRLDAFVWAFTELVIEGSAPLIVSDAVLARSRTPGFRNT